MGKSFKYPFLFIIKPDPKDFVLGPFSGTFPEIFTTTGATFVTNGAQDRMGLLPIVRVS